MVSSSEDWPFYVIVEAVGFEETEKIRGITGRKNHVAEGSDPATGMAD